MDVLIQEIRLLKKRLNEDEQKISQFYDMLHEVNASNIDYLAMETGVDLDEGSEGM